MGWFERQRGGDLAARLTSDLEMVESIWSHFLGVFVSGLAMPCFLLLLLALSLIHILPATAACERANPAPFRLESEPFSI